MANYQSIDKEAFLHELGSGYDPQLKAAFPFYKGISSPEEIVDHLFFDPGGSDRPSKNAKINGNAYNLLLNHLPSWQILPLRKRSIIGTTSYDTARGFAGNGKVFYVFPKLGGTIVVAPKSDIWYSFSSALAHLGLEESDISLKSLNQYLAELCHSGQHSQRFDANWESLLAAFAAIQNSSRWSNRRSSASAKLLLKVLKKNKRNLVNFLNDIFDPASNGFKTIEYQNENLSPLEGNFELWTDTPCLLVEKATFEGYHP